MKKLKVDINEIAFTMETSDEFESITLFDTETGEIVSIPNELMSAVESNDEEEMQDLPDWEKDLIEIAENICNDEGGRYVDIPRKPSYEAYNLMVEFASSVTNKNLKEKLDIALDGKGAFRRFKNVISDYPDEEKKWFAFKDKKMREDVIEWLHDLGIEPEQD
jgi:biotin synthase-related radical SAM superfamily protein